MENYTKVTHGLSKLQSDIINDLISIGYLAGLIIGIFGFVLFLIELGVIYKIRSIDRWPVYPKSAVIYDSYMQNTYNTTTYSIVVMSTALNNVYYRTRASFIYKVNGQTYIGNRMSYNEPWESNPIIAKSENDLLSRGAKVDIMINPNDPQEAYIYNKPYDSHWKLLVGFILTLIGIYIILKV